MPIPPSFIIAQQVAIAQGNPAAAPQLQILIEGILNAVKMGDVTIGVCAAAGPGGAEPVTQASPGKIT